MEANVGGREVLGERLGPGAGQLLGPALHQPDEGGPVVQQVEARTGGADFPISGSQDVVEDLARPPGSAGQISKNSAASAVESTLGGHYSEDSSILITVSDRILALRNFRPPLS
ncbi:unnamed protein product [Amoebophrya sp. A25]|nr:unnamed protein product [Amoebophrya sp. A25]|eukprot:GSA25T00014813001.1